MSEVARMPSAMGCEAGKVDPRLGAAVSGPSYDNRDGTPQRLT
jgi:hypothetical protein